MWIALNDAFISIVDKAKDKSCLMVRARRTGDIEAVFADAKVVADAGIDYKYRAEVNREAVAAAISARIMGINYSNFKGSVHDHKRHNAYMKVWELMSAFQK
ncbi:MAG: hypothetical protein PHD82_09600 [Candidatus Riflebacteria bacterium]|nr:hypothetical protein [Candidatus Riflebacteria bacterium]